MAVRIVPEPTKQALAHKSSWAADEGKYPEDDHLRRHGFEIAERPKDGQATWIRKHEAPGRPAYLRPLFQAIAILVISRETREAADNAATK